MHSGLSECREYIGYILIQILTLINDYGFLSSMPFIDYGLGDFVVDRSNVVKKKEKKTLGKQDVLRHIFFKKKEINHLLSDIVINYLINKRSIKGKE